MALLERLHYPAANHGRVERAPQVVRDLLEKHAELRDLDFGTNSALQMLVHDWSDDTIWISLTDAQRQAAVKKVEGAQVRALQSIVDGKSPTYAVERFVANSKLRPAVARSLGMDDLAAQFADKK